MKLLIGADKKFYPASAKIDNNNLIVWSKQVTQPAAVDFLLPMQALEIYLAKSHCL